MCILFEYLIVKKLFLTICQPLLLFVVDMRVRSSLQFGDEGISRDVVRRGGSSLRLVNTRIIILKS